MGEYRKFEFSGGMKMMDVLEAVKILKQYCERKGDRCPTCRIRPICGQLVDNWNIKQISDEKIRGFEIVSYAPADIKLPVRSTEGSAGYDFFAPYDILVPAHGTSELVQSYVKAYMLKNEYLANHIRSSLAMKHGLSFVNKTCIIDSDYYNNEKNEGNICFIFRNDSDEDYTIKKGERMGQGIFSKYLLVDNDNADGERKGGVGSTGK